MQSVEAVFPGSMFILLLERNRDFQEDSGFKTKQNKDLHININIKVSRIKIFMLILVRENNYNFISSVGGDTTCGGEGREGGDVRQFVDWDSFLAGGGGGGS